ncbi:hypothetical protein CVU75_02320 [Candidatus Dependentiae bacterium HGW-Dependentiae-1]|nr:MAG: hypothetical protein CVU75_02320 [Candidatus Dependentiae bacterium HGW-Dependentiae-1]
MRYFFALAVALGVLGVLDFIWLGNVMTDFYKNQFGLLGCKTMVGMSEKWGAILVTYFLMALGFALFVFPRLSIDGAAWATALQGSLFGLVLFGVYELTSYIVFADWPILLVLVDTAWGMFAYAMTSLVAVFVLRWLR